MTVVVESKRLKITQAMRQFIEKQANKIIRKLGKNIVKMSVHLETISKKHNDPKANTATYLIAVPGKKVMVVRKTAADMYEAVTEATKEAFRHLRKVRERRLDAKHGKLSKSSAVF